MKFVGCVRESFGKVGNEENAGRTKGTEIKVDDDFWKDKEKGPSL